MADGVQQLNRQHLVLCALQRFLAHKEAANDTVKTMPVVADIHLACANAIQNWSLSRSYLPSLAERREGFTETWHDDDKGAAWSEEDAEAPASSPAPLLMKLVQFRPAWKEQLMLRISKIPHEVVNSKYAVYELTGPLPCLQEAASAVGCNQDLQKYLQERKSVDLDGKLTLAQQQDSVLLTLLTTELLVPAHTYLCFKDSQQWEQFTKPQCVTAAGGGDSHFLRHPFAHWQAWSERVQFLQKTKFQSQDEAKEAALAAYDVLEQRLTTDSSSFLLGTADPTKVDCLLWDHLMQVVLSSNSQLSSILAESCPKLLAYTQRIWERYEFSTVEANGTNAFTSPLSLLLPHDEDQQQLGGNSLALSFRRDLRASLLKLQRRRQEQEAVGRKDPLETWNRWRRGGTYKKPTKSTARDDKDEETERRRSYQRNDELWLAAVVVTTAAAVVGFGQQQQQA